RAASAVRRTRSLDFLPLLRCDGRRVLIQARRIDRRAVAGPFNEFHEAVLVLDAAEDPRAAARVLDRAAHGVPGVEVVIDGVERNDASRRAQPSHQRSSQTNPIMIVSAPVTRAIVRATRTDCTAVRPTTSPASRP